ncbi:hypothetical protein pdam_00024531 [Pocillopora damicornis]|uniref:Uncharacterized protein n=1 Tax=Pocillopora damicornis TaxID=46731 RepID=A0A3M6U7Q3_POCDA|nr:hypothetical protein pdam_00024531 [Pocillopora damicornis]
MTSALSNWCSNRAASSRLFREHILRQSKSDEVTGRTGEADGLGDIPATQPPLTTPLERRHIPLQLSMTHGQLGVLTQSFVVETFLNKELF